MNRRYWALLLCLSLSFCAEARSRKAVPLMPEPANAPDRLSVTEAYAEESPAQKRPTSLGIEMGAIGRGANAKSDVLGMDLLFGGRFFFRFPMSRYFYLKPSAGYFRRTEGAGAAAVTQNDFEGGLTLQFVTMPSSRTRLIVGLVNRVEALMSTISAYNSSGNSPLAWRFRMGPSLGVAHSLDRDFNLIADVEAAASFTNPVRAYGGLTLGVMYRID